MSPDACLVIAEVANAVDFSPDACLVIAEVANAVDFSPDARLGGYLARC